jgi:nitrite reductase (NADH) small subunit
MFVDVGSESDFEEGIAKTLNAEGRDIGVVRWRGEVFALRNICPHEYGPVCSGYAMPMLIGEPDGVIDIDEDRLVIVCPWHGWEFNAKDGLSAWGKSNFKLKTYPTEVRDGRVLVDVGTPKRAPAAVSESIAGGS